MLICGTSVWSISLHAVIENSESCSVHPANIISRNYYFLFNDCYVGCQYSLHQSDAKLPLRNSSLFYICKAGGFELYSFLAIDTANMIC
jgi:hypothetical protein